jgi:hypothetical protein
MNIEFDVAPLLPLAPGLDTSMDPNPTATPCNSAEPDQKPLQLALFPSDEIPHNITTSGGQIRSSTGSSFVFQTLEYSRHNPNLTNAQPCLNKSESNAKCFALSPFNLADSDAIANAALLLCGTRLRL